MIPNVVELAGVLANLSLPSVEGAGTAEVTYHSSEQAVRVEQCRLLPADIQALLADYATGLKIVELVERYGINRSTVYAHLKRHDVGHRPTTKLTPEQIAEAAEAYRAGATSTELGERYAVGCDTILRSLRKVGVQLRPGGRQLQV